MRIGIWLGENYDEKIGGGYSYYSKLISSIDNYEFDKKLAIVFITTVNKKINIKKAIVYLPTTYLSLSFYKKVFYKIISLIPFFRIYFRQKRKLQQKQYKNNEWKKILQKNNIDILFYPLQTQCEIEDFPFIATNWDIGHKSTFAFPEFVEEEAFEWRNKWYSNTIHKAFSIFVESETGKQELIKYTGIFSEKIMIVPMFSGNAIKQNISIASEVKFLMENKIEKNKYFFYPAQFWAHKNHYNLIRAFKEIYKENNEFKLVFTGSNQGNLNYIKSLVKSNGLEQNILFFGFVKTEEINVLYKNAIALVFPSFLGPTNMPLLEAQELNCPVLCSNLKGHKELLGDSALYFQPDDYMDIKNKMTEILNKNSRKKILRKAIKRIENSSNNISTAIKAIEQHFLKINNIRSCW